MKKIIAAAGLAGALLAVPSAHAVPVTEWDYRATLEWTGADFTTGSGRTQQNQSVISWGATAGNFRNPSATPANGRSALQITDASARGTVFTNGGPAPTNTITHFNNAILSSFALLSAAQVETTLTLTPVVPPLRPAPPPLERDFTIRFVETFNRAPCEFQSTTVCDDIFLFTLGSSPFSFDYQGSTYTVDVVESTTSLFELSQRACAVAGAMPGCAGFQTPEGAFTPVSFAFSISTETAAELPEPGMLALTGLGLLGLGTMRRRKNG